MQLTELDLTDATRGVLEKADIFTVEDLLPHREDFTKIKFVGPGRAAELEEAIEASELGLASRPDPVPEGDPPPSPEPSEEEGTIPFGKAQPGDLVFYRSEHGRPRYARLGAVTSEGKASLTIFVQGGGRYTEDDVRYSRADDPRSWHEMEAP